MSESLCDGPSLLTLPSAAAAAATAAAVTARVEPRLLLQHVADTSLTAEHEHCAGDAGELENCQRILRLRLEYMGLQSLRDLPLNRDDLSRGWALLTRVHLHRAAPSSFFFHMPDVFELRNGFTLFQRGPRLT